MSRWWKNIGTPESLLGTSHLILGLFEPTVEGEVQGEVVGEVIVDEEAIVGGKFFGSAYMGADTVVGRKVIIEHYVLLERGV